MSKIINLKTDFNYFYSVFALHIFFYFEEKPKQKHMLFVSIPMGVYAYQAADWSVDVRHSTMIVYVTKITLEIIVIPHTKKLMLAIECILKLWKVLD